MIKALGVIVFFLGIYGFFWSEKNKFNRRNDAGVEEYSSFEESLIYGAIELGSRGAFFLGLFMFFLG